MVPAVGAILGSALGAGSLIPGFSLLGGGLAGGALGGALGGGVGSAASGGNFLKGAMGGALGGLLGPVAGSLASGPLAGLGAAAPYVAQGLLGGVTSSLQGGNFLKGALGGVVGSGIGNMLRSGISSMTSGGTDTMAPITEATPWTGGSEVPVMGESLPNPASQMRMSDTLGMAGQVPMNPSAPVLAADGAPMQLQASPTLGGVDIGAGVNPYLIGTLGSPAPQGAPQAQEQKTGPNYQTGLAGPTGFPDWYASAMEMPGGLSYSNIVAPQNQGLFGGMNTEKVLGTLLQAMMSQNAMGQAQKLADPYANERAMYLGKLRELEANPSLIYNSPDYQAAYDQGLKALSRAFAARRMGDSGNYLLARQKYGQTLAAQGLSAERQRLAQTAGAFAPTGSAQTYPLMQGTLYQNILAEALPNFFKSNQTGILYGA